MAGPKMTFHTNSYMTVICLYAFHCRLVYNIYRPQTKFAKVMFLQVSVILSTGGGVRGCSGGRGMRGCSGGHAWLLPGGVHGCSGGGHACFYDEIRSMSGRYASYWNAYLFNRKFSELLLLYGSQNISPPLHYWYLVSNLIKHDGSTITGY